MMKPEFLRWTSSDWLPGVCPGVEISVTLQSPNTSVSPSHAIFRESTIDPTPFRSAMATLLCFGLGYTAKHFIASYRDRFDRVFATVRSDQRAAELSASHRPWLTAIEFDGKSSSSSVRTAIADADDVLVSVPPDTGDVVLAACGDALSRASHLCSVVYLSSIGVYGNHDGAWVDEESECRSSAERDLARRAAERAWQDFSIRAGVPVAILRLAAIYGPCRNALVSLKRGVARRIDKPGQVFNRIHVADIARTVDAAFERRADGIFNVADDEPTPPGDPIAFAARLLGVEQPPEIPFSEAQSSVNPSALSFYADIKRTKNAKLKSALGVTLQFPTYREGLAALHHDCASAKNCSA
jgi:nucleoside-diphosphate-sugar epimerase